VETGRPASETLRLFEPLPQRLENVRFAPGAEPLGEDGVSTVIDRVRAGLGDAGRLVIRPSGTEPVIRVMAEAEDRAAVDHAVEAVAEAIRAQGN
jgi:Phosphomannomutase